MSSPFPGMDPYLEEPGLWPDVHHELISVMRELLNCAVRPKYHVRVEERVYVSDEDDPGRGVIVPDLRVAESGRRTRRTRPGGEAATATLIAAEPLVLTTLIDDEIHEARLEVVDREQRRVVTVIEILSPTNKVAGSRGRASYLEKRQEVMTSPSHLVEIDLLRAGMPLHTRETLPRPDYCVHASRTDLRPKGLVWPITLQQRLPVISIPLRLEDPEVPLDLQEVLNTAYERAAYDLAIDYGRETVPPLTVDQRRWADELLKNAGVTG
ncbi:MAG: DUF4058 family protein [Planctomycetota bacterium]|nr:DUF4058 family protein [Planctomycetota bacterium]